MSYQVFVYGTLLNGESNHHIAVPHLLKSEPGTIHGCLYNVGRYPAVVLNDKNKITGEWFTITEEGLRQFDTLEGHEPGSTNNHYDRVWIADANNDQEGYVYTFTEEQAAALEEIPSGNWINFRRKKHLR
ncbi:gamma-glutamylcyclotransferase [Halobacillus salinarum]|uniref:Gamma-glutamylcyclotransferase n=1 Tax=Halobacillus salinarum TaxID=2932257 RepID=A0ABY4EGV3_9BACI|nr:gamma-glutamylcyclotransferase family protein [Halobacillus salinarum]UOQ43704.1 gamma-glutamylcyclotransferase [Halobacillus salinarum]